MGGEVETREGGVQIRAAAAGIARAWTARAVVWGLSLACSAGALAWEPDLSGVPSPQGSPLEQLQAAPQRLLEPGWWAGLDDKAAKELLPELAKEPLLRQGLARLLLRGDEGDAARLAEALLPAARAFAEASTPDADERAARFFVECAASADDELALAALGAFERVLLRRAQLGDETGVERFAAAWTRAGGAQLEADLLRLRRALAAQRPLDGGFDALLARAQAEVRRLEGEARQRASLELQQVRALAALRVLEEARAGASAEVAPLLARTLECCAAWRAELEAALARAGAGASAAQALARSRLVAARADAWCVELLARLPQGDRPLVCDAQLAACAGALQLASQAAQLEAARGGGALHASLDAVLEDAGGPFTLLYDGGPLAARAADARLAVAALLAAIAPEEHFAVACAVAPEARAEVERVQTAGQALLARCAEAQVEDLGRRAGLLALSIGERERRGLEADLEGRRELDRLEWRRSQLLEALEPDGTARLLELRTPSWLPLEAARLLRDEGRAKEARTVLEGLRARLDADARTRNWLWGIELLAAVESSLGSTLSDEGDGGAAAAQLETSAARLEELLALLESRGDAPRLLQVLRNQLSSVHVSLAVNANVKRRDPQAALEWFEKAWALRQDETMRVLGACYRARAGRADEARRLLEGVVPAPAVHYNLACAHALLGDTDVALEFLRLELSEPGATAGARARRKQWAREDPDLASLRDDPRFQTLVAP